MRLEGLSRTALGSLRSYAVDGIEGAQQFVDFLEKRDLLKKYKHFNFKPSVIRTEIFDDWIIKNIKQKPISILNIACGFCTRYIRIKTNYVTWTDMDLEQVIDIRKQVMPELLNDSQYSMIVQDITKMNLEKLKEFDLVIAEGIFCYLDRRFVREFISNCNHIIFDVLGSGRKMVPGKDQKWLWYSQEWTNFNIKKERCYLPENDKDDRIFEIIS